MGARLATKTNGIERADAFEPVAPPPADKPKLPTVPDVPELKPETEAEVLARYGKVAGQIPTIMLAAADATRLAARKLVEESAAGVAAAEDILKMLKDEHEVYSREVMRHSENVATRLTAYFTHCHAARQCMAQHREAIIEVAAQVANTPAVIRGG